MSVICTWKQRDEAKSAIGCEATYEVSRQGDVRSCGDECSNCGRVEYCEACNDFKYEIEQFEKKQLTKARAQSKRKKAGGK